jgi:hypothetical protein
MNTDLPGGGCSLLNALEMKRRRLSGSNGRTIVGYLKDQCDYCYWVFRIIRLDAKIFLVGAARFIVGIKGYSDHLTISRCQASLVGRGTRKVNFTGCILQ